MSTKQPLAAKRRALHVERLERRALLAGELTAELVGPADNDPGGTDLNPEASRVHVDTTGSVTRFAIHLSAGEPSLDAATVTAERFQLQRGGELLTKGTDYDFSFDEATGEAALVSAGEFPLDRVYEITLDNSAETGIKDQNGGRLAATRDDGTTRFTILLTDGVNAAPENQVPLDQATAEDVPLVFNAADGSLLSVSDPDAGLGSGQLDVTITAEHGVITLATLTDLEFVTGDGAEDATVHVRGLAPAIDAALEGLQFSPDRDYFGPASLTLTTNDLGNFAGPAAEPQSDSDTVSINITAVNDAPVNRVPESQTIDEDTDLVFDAAHGNLISIEDVDVGEGTVQVTLAVDNGSVDVLPVPGIDFAEGSGNRTATVTFSGTLSDVNAALSQVTFRPNPQYFGSATLSMTTSDEGTAGEAPLTNTDTISIAITAIADSPINGTPPERQQVDEDRSLTFTEALGNSVSITDLDVPGGSGQIGLSLLAVNGTVDLALVAGLTFSSGDGHQDSLVNLVGSAADVNAALATLQFTPSADYSGPARLVVVSSKAGVGTGSLSDLDLIEIDVRPVNDAPVNVIPGDQTAQEDQTLVFSAATGNAISVRDVDVSSGTSTMEVTLTATHGVLDLDTVTGLVFTAGDGSADAAATFSGSLDNINAALSVIRFAPEENYAGPAQLTLKTNDQGNSGAGGAKLDDDAIALVILPINDIPIAVNDGQRVHQGIPATIDVLKNDFDIDGSLNPGSVRIVTNPEHGTAKVNGDGTISYTADEAYAGVDSFSYTVEDDSGSESNVAMVILRVNANPRAEDDQAGTKPNTDVSIDVLRNDSDSDGTLDPTTVEITADPAHGTVKVEDSGRITYTPNPAFIGLDTFQYRVHDDCGGVSNDATVTVRVFPEFPFQNQRSRFDVNDDGHVTAVDVLLIVNLINISPNFPGPLPDPPAPPFLPPPFYDVSGDNHVTAVDALLVISHINSRDQNGEREGEGQAELGGRRLAKPEGEASTSSEPMATTAQAGFGAAPDAIFGVSARRVAAVFPIDRVAGFATTPRQTLDSLVSRSRNGAAAVESYPAGPPPSALSGRPSVEHETSRDGIGRQAAELEPDLEQGDIAADIDGAASLRADFRDQAIVELYAD